MADISIKSSWLMSIWFLAFTLHTIEGLTICPAAEWSLNGTKVASSVMVYGDSGFTVPSFLGDIYIDTNDSLYLSDQSNLNVQRWFPGATSGIIVVNGSRGSDSGQFLTMTDFSLDYNGNIYILDADILRVTKWTPGAVIGSVVAGGNGTGNSSSQLNTPLRIFVEQNTSVIWIADSSNHRIVKWPTPSTGQIVCGGYGSEADQFNNPSGLFIDESDSNTLYVADTDNHRIQQWLPGATSGITVAGITNFYGNGLNQLWAPRTLLVDTNKNMFILDYGNYRIMRWSIGSSSGEVILRRITYELVPGVLYQRYQPSAIRFDSNGALFIIDGTSLDVVKFNVSCPETTNMTMLTTTTTAETVTAPMENNYCAMTMWTKNATTFGGSSVGVAGSGSTQFASPTDVFIDYNDVIYVSDASNFRVQRWLPGETIPTTVIQGTPGVWLDQFSAIVNIRVDFDGNIYILDSGNMRVTKWTPGAVIGSIVAGGNGVGTDASQLSGQTFGMYVEQSTLTIWIADSSNHRIVKWPTPSTGQIVCGGYGSEADHFISPSGLFIDESDSNTLYVADSRNHRIQQWLPGATNGTTVAGITGVCGNGLNQLCFPYTLSVDMDKNMFIVDTDNNRVMRWRIDSSSGEVIAGDTTFGVMSYQLFNPVASSFDSSGALLIVDYSNNRLQKFAVSCLATNTTSGTRTTRLFTTTTSVTVTSSTTSSTLLTTSTTAPITTKTTMATATSHSSMKNSTSAANIIFYPKLLSILLYVVIVYANQ